MKKNKIILAFTLYFIPILNAFAINEISKVSCAQVTDIPAKIPELTSWAIRMIQVAVPVLLVIMGSIDLFKGITAQKEDEMKKGQQTFIKRLIVAVLIFFVVVIVKFIISIIAESSTENIIDCVDCFISENCNDNPTTNSSTNTNKNKKPITNSSTDSNTNEKPTTNSSTNTNKNKKPITNSDKKDSSKKIKSILFVGDSRTVGMCETYKLCEENKYIAEVGKGYSWFIETAIPSIDKKIKSKNYNIIILMGVNDVGKNGTNKANSYFNKISSLASGKWKNQNIIFVSVNPVTDGKSNAYMSGVNSFNKTMKSKIKASGLKNLKYCNTISELDMSKIDSGDGLHYNKTGYKTIYNAIKNNCL